jgi:uncharacterized protein (DUF934 family)
MEIIKDRRIVTDGWRHVADDEAVPETGDVIVSLARWRSEGPALRARAEGRVGVRVRPDEDVDATLATLPLVALEFPKFTDGRGYTKARLLRERYGFSGELRAVGYVLRDQIFYMARCGIDAFELAKGKSLEQALGAFDEMSVTYQGAADDPRPLWRRRA